MRVRVATGSMAPTVGIGDEVTVWALPARVGDVALLRTGDAFTLHRLVARAWGRWVHKGDAPGAWPGLAGDADVVGVAELARRPPPWRAQVVLAAAAILRAALARAIMR